MQPPLITKSPEILGGIPVFYGTRVPVQNLIDYLAGGDSLDDFPTVSREQAIRFLEDAGELMKSEQYEKARRRAI